MKFITIITKKRESFHYLSSGFVLAWWSVTIAIDIYRYTCASMHVCTQTRTCIFLNILPAVLLEFIIVPWRKDREVLFEISTEVFALIQLSHDCPTYNRAKGLTEGIKPKQTVIPAGISHTANRPTRVSPFTVHFRVSQFGWQLWFIKRE